MKKTTFRARLFCLLLALVMAFSLLPAAALAAGDITVYVTVSDKGVLAAGTDASHTVMAGVPVTVTPGDDGKATVDAVLQAAHAAYCSGGYTTVQGSYGLQVTKLWGVETTNTLFLINGSGLSSGVGTDKMSAGDSLTASINKDDANYSDYYTAFDKTSVTVYPGQSFDLTLKGHLGMAWTDAGKTMTALSGVSVGTASAGVFTPIDGKSTDADGKVSLSFAAAGTYIVSASGTVSAEVSDYSKKPDTSGNYPTMTVSAPTMAPYCVVTVKLPDAAITVPSGASLYVGTTSKYYVRTPAAPVLYAADETAGTTTYYYDLKNGTTYDYRVSGDGYVTYAGTFQKTANYALTVGDTQLKPDGKTASTVDHVTTSNNGFNVADVYLNINAQNYLKLASAGSTFQIVALRNWETVNSVVSNYFIEPDFHYTVVGLDGQADDSVVSVSPSGLLTAKAAGTAIVLVTYDAIDEVSAAGGPFFGAVWPENTGVFVVSVGAGDSGISTGMTMNAGKNTTADKLSGDAIDAELDVVYFTGDQGAYTFTPATSGCTVSVANPTVAAAMSFSGFEAVSKNADGSFTVPLTEGRNIVCVSKNGALEYQVVTAKQVTVTVSPENAKPGDTVTVKFSTLYHPANKLAGVYNMSAIAAYSNVTGYAGSLIGSSMSQYNFASNAAAQTVGSVVKKATVGWMTTYSKTATLTIPADFQGTEFKLSGGSLIAIGFGLPYGNHRGITLTAGKDVGFNAELHNAYFGSLPDVTIPVTPKTVKSIALTTPPTKTAYYEGDSFDPAGMAVTATYTDDSTAAVTSYTVSPTALAKDTTAVTLSYGGKTLTVPVTVTPLAVTSIAVTTPPARTAYTEGDAFNPSGMVVTATYNSGKTAVVTDYAYAPARALKTSDTQMTITLGTAAATTPITVAASSGETTKTITVYFTLLGDAKHGGDGEVHTLRKGNLTTWIARTGITLPAGSTALDAIRYSLGVNGISYESSTGSMGTYISSVKGLAAMDNGTNSGWMYTVNGNYPNVSVGEKTLKDGDAVVFHYTDDYTLEKASDEWSGGGSSGSSGSKTDAMPFTDVKTGAWYYDAAKYVYGKGLFTGTTATTFAPDADMSRAMLVTVLYRMEGSPAVTGASAFTDVVSGSWYEKAVVWAAANGIVKGTSETTFDPDTSVTREQAAAILYRYAKYKNYDVSVGEETNILSYDDAFSISEYAYPALQWAVGASLMQGDAGKLSPAGTATRAQLAAILMRMNEKYVK